MHNKSKCLEKKEENNPENLHNSKIDQDKIEDHLKFQKCRFNLINNRGIVDCLFEAILICLDISPNNHKQCRDMIIDFILQISFITSQR